MSISNQNINRLRIDDLETIINGIENQPTPILKGFAAFVSMKTLKERFDKNDFEDCRNSPSVLSKDVKRILERTLTEKALKNDANKAALKAVEAIKGLMSAFYINLPDDLGTIISEFT